MKMEQSVPKRRHIKFRRRGIIQKKTSYIQTTAEVCNLPAYEEGTECSETWVYKIQTPGNYPEENTKHTENGENL
jgi:hypothetical protein